MRRSLDETNVMARPAKPARQTVPSWDRRFALLYRAALSLPFPYPRRCRIALLAENGSANVAAVLHRDGGEGKRGMTARVAPRLREAACERQPHMMPGRLRRPRHDVRLIHAPPHPHMVSRCYPTRPAARAPLSSGAESARSIARYSETGTSTDLR